MKLLIVLSLFISSIAFATETKTQCPWMREMNKRSNPKANMVNTKIRSEVKANSVAQ
ncbi:MAG: hypothetical protein H0V66_00555 [Bdellovibrionales bacterium]|nr:hypothetical protein [Bdellovibrionales bacterium]